MLVGLLAVVIDFVKHGFALVSSSKVTIFMANPFIETFTEESNLVAGLIKVCLINSELLVFGECFSGNSIEQANVVSEVETTLPPLLIGLCSASACETQ